MLFINEAALSPCRNEEKFEYDVRILPFKHDLILMLLENHTVDVLILNQPMILLFLFHKSATICQIDSNKVSNSTLKSDRYNCIASLP